jgi:hypothetical protein
MYGLLPPGRERHEALLAEGAGDGVRSGLAPHYQRFLRLNDDFKNLCTEWQVRDGQPNDHGDPDYDRACTDRLASLCLESVPVIEAMADTVPRFARYSARLAHAAERVADGEINRFTGVMCESFHDIWMELHEDLIVMQGIDRAEEGSF